MKINKYKDKRLLTMINQSYNFDKEIIVEVCVEAFKRIQ